MNSKNKRDFYVILKWILYTLVLFLAYVLQGTPGFLDVGGIKPVFIIPVAVFVAMNEDLISCAWFGALCGLMWDLSSGRPAGFFAISFLLICFFSNILSRYILRNTLFNTMLLVLGVSLFVTFGDFLFGYWMRGYKGKTLYYFGTIIPIVIFTTLISPAVRWIMNKIYTINYKIN